VNLQFADTRRQHLLQGHGARALGRYRKMFSDKLIRVGGATALMALLDERGVDFAALAIEAGLSAARLCELRQCRTCAALCRLLHLAEERTGLSDIGLRACVGSGIGALGRIGYLAANSANRSNVD